MVRLWLTQFGEEETVRLMECNNQRPTFSLRFDTIFASVLFDLVCEENAFVNLVWLATAVHDFNAGLHIIPLFCSGVSTGQTVPEEFQDKILLLN